MLAKLLLTTWHLSDCVAVDIHPRPLTHKEVTACSSLRHSTATAGQAERAVLKVQHILPCCGTWPGAVTKSHFCAVTSCSVVHALFVELQSALKMV